MRVFGRRFRRSAVRVTRVTFYAYWSEKHVYFRSIGANLKSMSVVERQLKLIEDSSFFLFGARGTGKSSLLRSQLGSSALWIDLLSSREEQRFAENPDLLSEVLRGRPGTERPTWVVIDEIQKVPRLLDVVHREVEARSALFALSGSSARKLRRGGANLLAGRALVHHLYPFTHHELGEAFNLSSALEFGTLPVILSHVSARARRLALRAYVDSYLKEEIVAEQIVRNLIPFRKFLPVVAQSHGGIVNYSEIARALSVDDKTVKGYFEILEDTLIGFKLPAYERSLRKQQIRSPKFYLFDTGVARALGSLDREGGLSSQELGLAFEHFIIAEVHRLRSYNETSQQFYFLNTGSDYEIDLVVESNGARTQFVEIKYTDSVNDAHLRGLRLIRKAMPDADFICLCREPRPRQVDGIMILPWENGIVQVLAR
jgi:uncharacterized protein